MKKWGIGGAVIGFALVWVILAPPKPHPVAPALQPAPVAAPAPAPVAAVAPPTPPESVVLVRVVDVTDIDALLDPPPVPDADVIPVGFEEPAAPAVAPATDAVPIPPAVEDDEAENAHCYQPEAT